ncbi:MAG TPA: N-acetylmuramoyl-L-alanine amidase [Syntrophales bacterium]|nr:N-acetylmuramoyl-L-alanine amidase [Syntrophales bacterium]
MLIIFLPMTAAGHMLVVDPGHGGSDTGVALSRSVDEKDVTLNIARHIKKKLSGVNGIDIRLTRLDDRDVSIEDRKKIVEKLNADLFISLHVNAGFGQNAEGYEIYSSSLIVPSAKESNSKEIVENMEQTAYLNDSVRFGQIVQKNIRKIFPRKGRGLRDAPIFILKSLKTPAILMEIGFATNVNDKKLLRDEKMQEDIADVLTKSVQEYFSTGGAS